MEKMCIKWPAFMDDAGIRRELEETQPIKKWADLPRKLGRKGYMHSLTGNSWDKPYKDHSYWHTDGHRKVRAIVKTSVDSNIQTIRAKIKGLLPSCVNTEDFLDRNYNKETEDGLLVDSNGYITEKANLGYRHWRSRERYYNLEGLIKGIKINKSQYHFTKEELTVKKKIQLKLKQERVAEELEIKRKGDFYLHFINMPVNLKEMTSTDSRWETYWFLLRYLYGIVKDSCLDNIGPTLLTGKMMEIEDEYFKLTGKKYREGDLIK